MHYPMLKYFSVNAHPPSLGIMIEKEDSAESVRHNLINRLEMEQQEGRGSTWPNIAPYRYNHVIQDPKQCFVATKIYFYSSKDTYIWNFFETIYIILLFCKENVML